MTKKVCLVGPAYPFRGGISHYTSLLAGELAKHHSVRVINFHRLYPSFLFPGKTQFDESGSPLAVDSERVIDSINPFSFWRAARRIIEFEPDIVIFKWWQPFFAFCYYAIVFLVRRKTDARIVFVCHNVLPHESSVVDRTLIRIAFKLVDSYLVHSEEDKSNLIGLKPNAAVAVRPLPTVNEFNKGRYTAGQARSELSLEGPVLLFFGLIRPYKGLEVLIDAFAVVRETMAATLLIVGEFYEDKAQYLSRIAKHELDQFVRVVDHYVPNEQVEKYFLASDVAVLPYHSATQSAIVQVAYSFDKPVIVTNVGGLPDVVENGVTGFVVEPGDPGALADAVVRFYKEDAAAAMTKNIAVAKKRFAWDGYVRAIESLAHLTDARGGGTA